MTTPVRSIRIPVWVLMFPDGEHIYSSLFGDDEWMIPAFSSEEAAVEKGWPGPVARATLTLDPPKSKKKGSRK